MANILNPNKTLDMFGCSSEFGQQLHITPLGNETQMKSDFLALMNV